MKTSVQGNSGAGSAFSVGTGCPLLSFTGANDLLLVESLNLILRWHFGFRPIVIIPSVSLRLSPHSLRAAEKQAANLSFSLVLLCKGGEHCPLANKSQN